MAIPIPTALLKIYRQDPNTGQLTVQLYPHPDAIGGDTIYPADYAINANLQNAKQEQITLLGDRIEGVKNVSTQDFYKIFADYEPGLVPYPEWYPDVNDIVKYEDTSGEAPFATGCYKVVVRERPHTGTKLAHLLLTVIPEAGRTFTGFED